MTPNSLPGSEVQEILKPGYELIVLLFKGACSSTLLMFFCWFYLSFCLILLICNGSLYNEVVSRWMLACHSC